MNDKQELHFLLSLNLNELRKSRFNHWKSVLGESNKKDILVFGAGELGLKTINGLLKSGLTPKAILDNRANDNTSKIFDIPVVTPNKAAQIFDKNNTICLVSVFNTSAPKRQLKELGFINIIHCVLVFAAMPESFLPYVCLDDTDIIFNNKSNIIEAYEIMGDITSMQCYISQLRHRLFLNFDKVLQPQTPEMKESE